MHFRWHLLDTGYHAMVFWWCFAEGALCANGSLRPLAAGRDDPDFLKITDWNRSRRTSDNLAVAWWNRPRDVSVGTTKRGRGEQVCKRFGELARERSP